MTDKTFAAELQTAEAKRAAAAAVLTDLTAKRDGTFGRAAELAQQRKAIAFDAHTGDGAARKNLDTINRAVAMISAERESLDDAITEAEARLALAQREVATAAERERAQAAGKQADELVAVVAEWDAAAVKLAELGMRATELAGTMARDQIPGIPPQRLFQLSLGRAFRSYFAVPLRHVVDLEVVPPGQRITLSEVTTPTIAYVQRWRNQICGTDVAEQNVA